VAHRSVSSELRQLERYWLRLVLILVIVGPVLAFTGAGGSLPTLAGFLVLFGVASAWVIGRHLRPAVTLVSNTAERARHEGDPWRAVDARFARSR
jgi:hypothetical protein